MTFTNSRNLPPNQIYYWRVASECAETDTVGSYSGAFSYRTGPVSDTSSAPALIAPANGVTTASIRVTLMYGSVPGADMYNVRLYSSLSDAQSDYPDHHYSTSNMAVIDVSNPTTWYSHVKSRNGYGWGDLSEIRMFRTPSLTASTTISPEAGGTLFAERRIPHGELTARRGEQPHGAELLFAGCATAPHAELSICEQGVYAGGGRAGAARDAVCEAVYDADSLRPERPGGGGHR